MARKSGSTIAQDELYPVNDVRAHADTPRESIDDARLIDLDVDEQSPFLRGQKRVSARKGSLPKKTVNHLLRGTVVAGILCAAGLAAASVYHYGEHSWRFRIDSSDDIQVSGTENVTKAQIMEVMGADIGRNIFFIPLSQQKLQLEQIPWVESASVMRFVPNRLKVEIHERQPVAFARVGPRIELIDASGRLMELPPKRKYSFPVILGMNQGEPLSTRAPRMKAYLDLTRELDSEGAHYTQDLSEVDLTDLEDVKVRVNDPQGDVLLHLGSSDYLKRYKIYVAHAQEWRQQFQKLDSVNLRYDNQVIVNPDLPSAPKKDALTLAVARSAAAAGVKPAALVSHLPLRGPGVPKPVFELSDSKLNPKPAAARKASSKPKLHRAATRNQRPLVLAKRKPTHKWVPATHVKWTKPVMRPHTALKAAELSPITTSKTSTSASGNLAKPSPAIEKQNSN